MFAANCPQTVKNNLAKLNEAGILKMSYDKNTVKKILIRLRKNPKKWGKFLTTAAINVIWWVIINV